MERTGERSDPQKDTHHADEGTSSMSSDPVVIGNKKATARLQRMVQEGRGRSDKALDVLHSLQKDSVIVMRKTAWLEVPRRDSYHRRVGARILLLDGTATERLVWMRSLYEEVICVGELDAVLDDDVLYDVLQREDAWSRAIGGIVDAEAEIVIICTGDLRLIPVALTDFKPTPVSRPDFSKFAVVDSGFALQLGEEYESTTTAALCTDPQYRRRYARWRGLEPDTLL